VVQLVLFNEIFLTQILVHGWADGWAEGEGKGFGFVRGDKGVGKEGSMGTEMVHGQARAPPRQT